MTEPTPGQDPAASEDGYLIFAEAFAKWTQKPPVKGLRNLFASEYPEATQVERDQLAMQFLLMEIARYIIPDQDPDSDKEPWQL